MNRIKSLRKERGWTQKDLGKLLNVQNAAISKYENETVPLTDETIKKLSEIFNVSSDYLLYKTDVRKPQDVDEEFSKLLSDPELLMAFKDLMNLSEDDKREIINYIKFKKNNN